MKVAAAQIACSPGDIKANLDKISRLAARGKDAGAELIVFPEMVDTGYSMPIIKKQASAWDKGAVPELRKIAKELSIGVVAGVSERFEDRVYNAQVSIDKNGEIVAKYRKSHLVTAAPLDERSCFTPGDAFTSYKVDEFTIGLTICYDLRFPEVCRKLAVDHGVNVFLNSSAWPNVRLEHLRALILARAIENQSYLILANRVGTDDGVTFCGTSAIIDPYGVILAAASADREEVLQAEISIDVINDVRMRIPAFDHRRADLY